MSVYLFRVDGTFMDIKTALRTTPYISKTFLLLAQPRLLIDSGYSLCISKTLTFSRLYL